MLDQQGIEACFLFPTLGVGMEEALLHDPEAAHAAFRAFNRWLDDDWGFDYEGRIFGAPYITLLDPDEAMAEAEWAVEQGARVIVMRAGPVMHPTRRPLARRPGLRPVLGGGRRGRHHRRRTTPASPATAATASTGASRPSSRRSAARRSTASSPRDRAISDTIAALICHGVFDRFPRLRVATIESGSEWVGPLRQEAAQVVVDDAGRLRRPTRSRRCAATSGWRPTTRTTSAALADAIGADHVLFGSDWPARRGPGRADRLRRTTSTASPTTRSASSCGTTASPSPSGSEQISRTRSRNQN